MGPLCVELAYAVGARHRGQSLAVRAIEAVLPVAVRACAARARLVIAVDNLPSQVVARRAGFQRTDVPLFERRRKGRVLQMQTWKRRLDNRRHLVGQASSASEETNGIDRPERR
jgi:RimJ/RimL family protein N-acetyltransferase